MKVFKANAPLLFLSLLILKSLIFHSSIYDAIATVAISAMVAYYHYLESSKEEPVNEAFKRELAAFKDNLKENKNQIDALKLSSTYVRR